MWTDSLWVIIATTALLIVMVMWCACQPLYLVCAMVIFWHRDLIVFLFSCKEANIGIIDYANLLGMDGTAPH